MAKAKKEQTTQTPPATKPAKPAGKAPANATGTTASKAVKGGKKVIKPATPTAAPLIDTNLAAQAAAKMLVNRDLLNPSRPETSEKRESNSFKQLKDSLTKPPTQGPASFLQSTAPQKKLNLPFGGRNQVGHNQTFGADVNRTGVPRRTGG